MFKRRTVLKEFLAVGLSVLLVASVSLPSRALDNEIVPKSTFKTIETDIGGRIGVAVLDLETGRRLSWRDNERFPMNSTFKLLLVAATLKRIEDGHEDLNRRLLVRKADVVSWSPVLKKRVGTRMSVGELGESVLVNGDNTATNLLLKAMGGPDRLTAFLRRHGDTITNVNRYEPQMNDVGSRDKRDTSTPRRMLENLDHFLRSNALSEQSKTQLMTWLTQSRTGRKRIRAGLPEDWIVGDRSGSGYGGRASNIAIAYPPGRRPVLISIYLDGPRLPMKELNKVHQSVARDIVAGLR